MIETEETAGMTKIIEDETIVKTEEVIETGIVVIEV